MSLPRFTGTPETYPDSEFLAPEFDLNSNNVAWDHASYNQLNTPTSSNSSAPHQRPYQQPQFSHFDAIPPHQPASSFDPGFGGYFQGSEGIFRGDGSTLSPDCASTWNSSIPTRQPVYGSAKRRKLGHETAPTSVPSSQESISVGADLDGSAHGNESFSVRNEANPSELQFDAPGQPGVNDIGGEQADPTSRLSGGPRPDENIGHQLESLEDSFRKECRSALPQILSNLQKSGLGLSSLGSVLATCATHFSDYYGVAEEAQIVLHGELHYPLFSAAFKWFHRHGRSCEALQTVKKLLANADCESISWVLSTPQTGLTPNITISREEDSDTKSKTYTCAYEQCHFTNDRKGDFKRHLKKHLEGWECPTCGRVFARTEQLKRHRKNVHSSEDIDTKSYRRVERLTTGNCPIKDCSKISCCSEDFISHQIEHCEGKLGLSKEDGDHRHTDGCREPSRPTGQDPDEDYDDQSGRPGRPGLGNYQAPSKTTQSDNSSSRHSAASTSTSSKNHSYSMSVDNTASILKMASLQPRSYETERKDPTGDIIAAFERLDLRSNIEEQSHLYSSHSLENSRSFRLLKLESFDETSKLRYSIRTASLDEAPPYAALSYAWGTSEDTRTIWIEDVPFQISQTLLACLTACSTLLSTKYYWADALCINQNDSNERLQQIKVMSDIYQKASSVFTWLGNAVKPTEKLLSLYHHSRKGFRVYLDHHHLHEPQELHPSLFVSSLTTFPATSIFDHKWVQRAWVCQECQEATLHGDEGVAFSIHLDLKCRWDEVFRQIATPTDASSILMILDMCDISSKDSVAAEHYKICLREPLNDHRDGLPVDDRIAITRFPISEILSEATVKHDFDYLSRRLKDFRGHALLQNRRSDDTEMKHTGACKTPGFHGDRSMRWFSSSDLLHLKNPKSPWYFLREFASYHRVTPQEVIYRLQKLCAKAERDRERTDVAILSPNDPIVSPHRPRDMALTVNASKKVYGAYYNAAAHYRDDSSKKLHGAYYNAATHYRDDLLRYRITPLHHTVEQFLLSTRRSSRQQENLWQCHRCITMVDEVFDS